MEGRAAQGRGLPSVPDGLRSSGAAATVIAWVSAATFAAIAIVNPLGLIAVIALLAVGAIVLVGAELPRLFLGTLAVLLVGYAVLGKGFAYIGANSIFVGELGLAVGMLTIVSGWRRIRVGAFEIVLLAFIGWGAVRTVPYIGTWGLDALRDAVSWGYSLFAVAILVSLRPHHLERLVDLYRRLSIPLVFWFPLAAVLTISFGDRLPVVPGSDTPIVFFKAGDVGVQLAGIAAFMFVGLAGRSAAWTSTREAVLWIGWIMSSGVVSALNRGAMVSIGTSVLALLFVRKANSWLIALAMGVLLISAAWILNPEVDIGSERKLSIQQFVGNAVSIVASTGDENEGTKIWRLLWWDKITDYTVNGEYFWTGKGYGVNLADDDGFQVLADGSLRAPHSANFEFLARSGVPGLALWVLLLVTIGATMLRAARVAAATGQRFLLSILGWLFVYNIAAVINMSVDVYLGGPQGGIWFWATVGGGIAVSRFVMDEKRRVDSVGQQARSSSDDGEQEARDHRGVSTP
jgi:O-Antigen ligase